MLERVFFLPLLTPLEQGLVRALGSVDDRFLDPFLFAPLWVLGLGSPGVLLPFAILDPVLAIGAYAIWSREVTSRDAGTSAAPQGGDVSP